MPCPHCKGCNPGPLSQTERHLLDLLAQNAFLPVARFLLQNPHNAELSFVMAAPVFLESAHDHADTVKAAGDALLSLQRRRFIVMDYGVPLQGFDYEAWKQSDHYRNFVFSCQSDEAVAALEPGSVALTLQGQDAIDEE